VFEPTSRYFTLETATLTDADGRVIAYKRRRFLPQPESLPVLVEVAVVPGDRLDLIAARTLGDPEQFWRLADANGAMSPSDLAGELAGEPVRALRVPAPQVQGV
jgi:hypothetical protein